MNTQRIYSQSDLRRITAEVRDYDNEGRVIAYAVCAFAGFVAGIVVAWWKWA